MKKLIFIAQSKGGAGKSVLSFLLAEKHPDAIIFDMDDATKTTSLQLAYRQPRQVTFLNSNKVIDRGLFNKFLEKTAQSKKSDLFFADLGASISEQLPYYLQDVIDFLPAVLLELGLTLEIYVVVGGANIYKQTMDYLSSLLSSVNQQIPIKVFQNQFYEFSNDQEQSFSSFIQDHHLLSVSFNISRDKNESTQNRINEVLKSGAGVEKATIFSRMYFQNAIKDLTI